MPADILQYAIALGAVEQCGYDTADCSGPADCTALPDDSLKLSCVAGFNYKCSGDSIDVEYYAKTDCSDDVSAECNIGELMPSGCHKPYKIGECALLYSVTIGDSTLAASIKYTGSCPAGSDDDPCFSREAEACRILDMSASPSDAFRACYDEPTLKAAERVPMPALSAGDYVLSTGKDLAYEFTRIIVNQHRVEDQVRPPPVPAIAHFPPMRSSRRAVPPNAAHARANPRPPDSNAPLWTLAAQKRSGVVKITHVNGELSLTPDHVLLVDGEWAAARTVKVGSSLSGSIVTAVSQGFGGIINPVTTNGMIVAAGPTGKPVVSSAYPEWIAEYMLEQNNGYYPLPVSMSSMLAYFFPATVQAYWDEILEHAFAANQQRLNSALLGLPTAFVAPIMFVLDLVCSAGLLLFALANAKVIATLVAVVAVARARRVAKA